MTVPSSLVKSIIDYPKERDYSQDGDKEDKNNDSEIYKRKFSRFISHIL